MGLTTIRCSIVSKQMLSVTLCADLSQVFSYGLNSVSGALRFLPGVFIERSRQCDMIVICAVLALSIVFSTT